MNLLNKTPILNKYVLYDDYLNDNSIKDSNLIITPRSHLFIVTYCLETPLYAINHYDYLLKSIKIKNLEIWAKIGQLIILEDNYQKTARILYGK